MDKYQQLAELLKDQDKANAFLSESVEETQKNLEKEGLDFTVDELVEIAEKVEKKENEGDELNEDSLDDVSGGVIGLGAALVVPVIITCGAGHVKRWLKRR